MERRRQKLRPRSEDFSKHRPLLKSETKSQEIKRARMPVGEFAGGTAAEFTAVCCCCPCTVVNLMVLTMYKVPACLCRKALERKRRQRMLNRQSKGLLYPKLNNIYETNGQGYVPETPTSRRAMSSEEIKSGKESNEFGEMEKEMWRDQIYGAGFWRSSLSEN